TFTTGSSGKPKGVNRTHRILAAQHERLAEAFPPREDDVDFCTFPVFALNNLALGVTTVISPADRHLATTATASPPLFDELAQRDDRPRFRRILTGGAPVSDLQLRNWAAAWPRAEIHIAYGSSEAEPVAHITAEERLKAGGRGYVAGKIVAGVRARIESIDRRARPREHTTKPVILSEAKDLPPRNGEDPSPSSRLRMTPPIGELLVAGEHVCRDYDRDPLATRQNKVTDAEGTVWHRMGDTGWFDDEGYFRIAGRVHSTIWRDGVPVHAQLVEQVARGDDPRIVRVAALAVGRRVAVVLETKEEGVDAELERDVRARLANAGEPCDVVIVTRKPLPVDPRHNSKIDYDKLRARL
ncbi:MAG TPA: AMP-binding protein, partial [Thermoanaerobaculia bacterium]